MTDTSLATLVRAIKAEDDGEVDLSDPFRPTGPYGLAKFCEAKLAELEAAGTPRTRSKRRAVRQQIETLRDMMKWCKSRAGYVEPDEAARQ